MTAEQAYAEVERLATPSLAFGSPPSFEVRLAFHAAEIAVNDEENPRGNLPVSPGPFPTARQAPWTPVQR